jgi:putative NADH-flavin reductase
LPKSCFGQANSILHFIKKEMIQHTKIAVLGGGGRTGNYLVNQLLNKGYELKLLLRHPENFPIQNPRIEISKGDALDAKTVHALIEDCQAIISTIGQRGGEPLVASQATLNILKAMAELKIQRYILVAGINIDTPFDKKGSETKAATEWMKSNFPLIHDDRQNAYSILSTSEVNWTLVRVPFIEFTNTRCETIVDLNDCRGNKINAAELASFLIEQLSSDRYVCKSPFIANT